MAYDCVRGVSKIIVMMVKGLYGIKYVVIRTVSVERFAFGLQRDTVHLLQHDREHGVQQQRTADDHGAVDRSMFEQSVSVLKGQQTAGRSRIDGVARSWGENTLYYNIKPVFDNHHIITWYDKPGATL